jgi:hypothetical protein
MSDIPPKKDIYKAMEVALAAVAKERYPSAREIQVTIDQVSGKIKTIIDGVVVDPPDFGRIAAQAGKRFIIQKVREAQRD